jgi:hypothetical protein
MWFNSETQDVIVLAGTTYYLTNNKGAQKLGKHRFASLTKTKSFGMNDQIML